MAAQQKYQCYILGNDRTSFLLPDSPSTSLCWRRYLCFIPIAILVTEINKFTHSHQPKKWKYHNLNPVLSGSRDFIPDYTIISLKTILHFQKIMPYQRGTRQNPSPSKAKAYTSFTALVTLQILKLSTLARFS